MGGRHKDSQITVALSRPSGHLPQATISESAQCPSSPLCRHCLCLGVTVGLPSQLLAYTSCCVWNSQALSPSAIAKSCLRSSHHPGAAGGNQPLALGTVMRHCSWPPRGSLTTQCQRSLFPPCGCHTTSHSSEAVSSSTAAMDSNPAPPPRMAAHLYSASFRDMITLVFRPTLQSLSLPFDSPQLPLTSS